MQWKIDGNPHFLDEERVMKKFMPFVTEVCSYSALSTLCCVNVSIVCSYPALSIQLL